MDDGIQRIELEGLAALFGALQKRGYELIGPTVRDGAIVLGTIETPDDLPRGLTDRQDGGTYRLAERGDGALFGYAVGAHSWKRYLFPPEVRLFQARRDGLAFETIEDVPDPTRRAFIGVRSCDLHAIQVQDRIFVGSSATDPVYAARRGAIFTVAVECGTAGGTCFCVSMETGPQVSLPADLVLTEVVTGQAHSFTVRSGSPEGAEVLAEVPHRPAGPAEIEAARVVVEQTAASMGRQLDTTDIHGLLLDNLEHPRWNEVAGRCLSCANCTLVCPTCFCATVEDTTDVTGDHAERWRRWDSCFLLEHSYIHGGSVRRTTRARYRQWLTHKLATWIDQFGTSGCVGCGRCITWCPVGIDITEEVTAIRAGTVEPDTGELP